MNEEPVVHDHGWFLDRVGKRILKLNLNGCVCRVCTDMARAGIVIRNSEHAYHLLCAQLEFKSRYVDV